jgi:hypothetical protein
MKYARTTNIFVDTLVFHRITSTEKDIIRFNFIRNISFQNFDVLAKNLFWWLLDLIIIMTGYRHH